MAGIGQIGAIPLLRPDIVPVTPARAISSPDVVRSIQSAMERMKQEPNAAANAQFLATKAHSVIRKDGEIVAVQWRDGTTEIRKPSGQAWDKERLIKQRQSSGLSKEQMNDLYVRDLTRTLGAGVTVDRYDDRSDAPTRGELMQSPASQQMRGRRLSLSA